ncbi:MAG: hypothetical protein F7C34_02540 [Desulfurococcales archaeon]|nr:hypothetical protein [Desulfurococcales archaeon]
MLEPRTISVARPPGPGPLLQAGLEALAGMLLEGRLQSAIISSRWGENSILLGYYEPYTGGPGLVRRRITGGRSAQLGEEDIYAGIVFASESLLETAELAGRIAECSGAKAWGATRIGPRRLAAGIIEIVGARDTGAPLECYVSMLSTKPALGRVSVEESARRIARAYEDKRWAHYSGANNMPVKIVSRRGDYWVRMGFHVTRDGFIAAARIDGVFNAAPPNEPYNLASAIVGMPANENVLMLAEHRLEKIEFYGVDREDVLGILERLVGGAGERG